VTRNSIRIIPAASAIRPKSRFSWPLPSGELFRAFAARSTTRIFLSVGVFTNLRLATVVGVSSLVQIAIHSTHTTQTFFQITSLSAGQWALVLAVGLGPVTLLELKKLAGNWGHGAPPS